MRDMIIIGAGIQGASAAYNLAKLDFGKILVLDQGSADDRSGATSRSASMIMQQTGNRRLSELAHRSYGILQSLEAELELEVPFVETGSILYGTTDDGEENPSGRRELEALMALQNGLGIETEWVDGADLPGASKGMLGGSELACGIFCAADGFTDGRAIRDAYLDAFARLGGEVRFDSRVIDIRTSGERVRSVVLDGGEALRTGGVLNCAGIHADSINRLVGAPLPLTVDRRFLALFDRAPSLPETFPIIEDHRHEWYFRPHSRGVLMGIGPTQVLDQDGIAEPDPDLDAASIEMARNYLGRFVPALASAQIVESWAGRRPLICEQTPDNLADILPRIGAVGSVEGMYQSAGWGAFGVTLAFVGGQLAAESILESLSRSGSDR